MAETRIYIVTNDNTTKLIEATSQAQALRHATKNLFSCKIPTTKQVAELLKKGLKLRKLFKLKTQCRMNLLTKGVTK
jgi:hypothetical protein